MPSIKQGEGGLTAKAPQEGNHPSLELDYEKIVLTGEVAETIDDEDAEVDTYTSAETKTLINLNPTHCSVSSYELDDDSVGVVVDDAYIDSVKSGNTSIVATLGCGLKIKKTITTQYAPSDLNVTASRPRPTSLIDTIRNELHAKAHDSVGKVKDMYLNYGSSSTEFTPHPDFWWPELAPALSGCSIWNTRGSNTRSGVLVTDQHILHAAHYGCYVGDVLTFRGTDDSIATRTVIGIKRHPYYQTGNGYHPDFHICTLDSPLDSNLFKVLPIASHTLHRYFGQNRIELPCVSLDKEEHLTVRALSRPSFHSGQVSPPANASFNRPKEVSNKDSLYEDVIGGDSSSPVFMVIHGQPVLLTVWTYGWGGSGTYTGASAYKTGNDYMWEDLNDMITAADTNASISTGKAVTLYDASAWTDYSSL